MAGPRRPTPGEPLHAGDALSASWLNWLLATLKKSQVHVDGRSGLQSIEAPDGTHVSVRLHLDAFWIEITGHGTGGFYSWTRIEEVAGGTWANFVPAQSGTAGGSDPAIEVNSNASVPTATHYRAWAERQTSGDLIFRASSC